MTAVTRPTEAQVVALAEIEQEGHVGIERVTAEESAIVARILESSVTDTIVYVCRGCLYVFIVEPDGTLECFDPAGGGPL